MSDSKKNTVSPSPFVYLLTFIFGGFLLVFAFDSLAFQYPIFLKNESFLSHAHSATAIVTKDYTEKLFNDFRVPEKVSYNFWNFTKNCNYDKKYREGKFARLKYQIHGSYYENDVWVVFIYIACYPREIIKPLPVGTTVDILYNTDDPNDIRLADDIVIKDMDKSWFSRHSHWFWIIVWAVIGIAGLTTLFTVLTGFRGLRLFSKCMGHKT